MDLICKTYTEINIRNVYENVTFFNSLIKKGTMIMAVVKADAYGHGVIEISKQLEFLDCIWGYGVADSREALELRKHGIKKPILILGKVNCLDYRVLIENGIRIPIDNKREAEIISRVALDLNKDAIVHIQIDTGMNRFGLKTETALSEIIDMFDCKGIKFEGIYTHFVLSDSKDRKWTDEQYHRFESLIKNLEKKGIDVPVKHCSNSFGIVNYPEYQMNLVRLGVLLYGIFPEKKLVDEKIKIKPVMSVYSYITGIRKVAEGEKIGYGGTYIADRDMIIATVDVGYSNGYPRDLSNRGFVIVKGCKIPIVGRVCMTQMMIDVTNVPNIELNEKVILVGASNGESVSIEDIAEICGTISQEIVCNLGNGLHKELNNGEAIIC